MTRLLILQHDSVFERYGGIQYYLDDFLSLASEVFGKENVQSLILQRGDQLRAEPSEYTASFVRLSKNRFRQKLQNRFSLSLYSRAKKVIEEFQPNLILSSHVSLGPVAYLLSKRTAIPYGVIVYGTDCWGDLWPQDEWSLKRASRIISISHWTKNILIRRNIPQSKIQIVHPRLSKDFEELSPRTEKLKDKLQILTVARLDASERYKGQDHTLEALAKVAKRSPDLDFRYTIQGDGDDKGRLEELSHSLGLKEKVRFVSAVKNRKDLEVLYKSADLFVMPSQFGKISGAWRGEGFGIVYVEAAAVGVPSVAYSCGGVMDIIEDNKTGWLVPPNDVDALAKRLEELLRDRSQLIATGVRARKHVIEKFTRPAIAKEMRSALSV